MNDGGGSVSPLHSPATAEDQADTSPLNRRRGGGSGSSESQDGVPIARTGVGLDSIGQAAKVRLARGSAKQCRNRVARLPAKDVALAFRELDAGEKIDMKTFGIAALGAAALAFAVPAAAQSADPYPFDGGDYVEVTGIDISDGSALKYANWLAGEWRANEDYFVQQGWNTSYEILANEHPREGEPDLYLIRRFKSFVDNAEGERRRQVMAARYKRTEEKLQEESAGRATLRTVKSTMLLRELDWKK